MIAQTLSYLNFSAPGPIVHGEVKLDNILFDEILSAKISDFGAPIGLFLQRVNIERDRGLEEMTASRVLVGSRIIFSDPCCFRISAGGEIGAAQLLRGGKEHITQTDVAEAIGASLLQSIGGGYTSVDMSIKSVYAYLTVISLGYISPEAKVQAPKAKARGQDMFTESISRWPLTLTHMPLILTPQIIPSSETEASAGCGVALCFLQRFVEAANAFLRRSKAKRSVMSSVPLLPTFLKDDVPLFPTFLNDDV
ncbi:unnamed protein product [Brassica oleracea]